MSLEGCVTVATKRKKMGDLHLYLIASRRMCAVACWQQLAHGSAKSNRIAGATSSTAWSQSTSRWKHVFEQLNPPSKRSRALDHKLFYATHPYCQRGTIASIRIRS